MSHITEQINKHLINLENERYHIEQLVKAEIDDCLKITNPNIDSNVVKLTQLGNIGRVCECFKAWADCMRIGMRIIDDMEKEAKVETDKD